MIMPEPGANLDFTPRGGVDVPFTEYSVDQYDRSWRATLKGYEDVPYLKQDTADPKVYWRRNRKAISAIDPKPSDRILDAGCGTGFNTLLLHEAFGCDNVTGCDFSPVAIAHARTHCPWARFDTCSVDAMPYADGVFDSALAMDITEHLPEDAYWGFVRELRRVVRPEGVVLVLPGILQVPGHIRAVGLRQTANEFHANGFRVIAAYTTETPGGTAGAFVARVR